MRDEKENAVVYVLLLFIRDEHAVVMVRMAKVSVIIMSRRRWVKLTGKNMEVFEMFCI
ncbi:hypothetical protein [Paenibacillus dendritiformis]|uniref:hypothetical protein n=1 Tax=Paenibacillus dendritiformis TaxID=130049 RepID=UPI00387E154D